MNTVRLRQNIDFKLKNDNINTKTKSSKQKHRKLNHLQSLENNVLT